MDAGDAAAARWGRVAAEADPSVPVLVLRALGLGDGLTGVPALRGLRRLLPGRLIVLATAHPVARLLHAHGLVDRVLPTTGLGEAPPGLALGRHLAVNLHGSGPESHRVLGAARPGAVLAFGNTDAGVDGPAWDPTEHEVARWCRLVGAAGAPCSPEDLRLVPADVAVVRTGPVVVHPGAKAAARRWPVQRWARVAAELAAAGHDVVVTGGTDEAEACAAVVAGAGLPATADLSGRLAVDDLADLVGRARLLLCGDTGVAHLATALATPSVVLFGPMPPALWGPAIDPHLHRALFHGAGPVPQDGPDPDPALLRITEAEVLDAAAALLAGG